MEIWKVVGYRNVDFKDQNGKQVTGYKLFLARDPENEKIYGLETQSIFISSDFVDYDPILDQMIEIRYNRYGKVSSIFPVEV